MYSIGIDLGGTAIKAGIVDGKGNIVVKDKVPTKSERGYCQSCINIGEYNRAAKFAFSNSIRFVESEYC